MKIIAMVPARSGSKGLPNKNIKNLNGLPLMAHSIIPAIESELVDSVYVNSDSQEYLDIGLKYGAMTYLRKAELANDKASLKSVLLDFTKFISTRHSDVDGILVLYPTYPFRTSNDLSDIISTYKILESGTSLVGLLEPKVHPYLIYERDNNGIIKQYIDFDATKYYRRQDYPVVHELSHWACIVPTAGIEDLDSQLINAKTYGYFINKSKVVDIDTLEDFLYAEYLGQDNFL